VREFLVDVAPVRRVVAVLDSVFIFFPLENYDAQAAHGYLFC
jgi:hypothetical protein